MLKSRRKLLLGSLATMGMGSAAWRCSAAALVGSQAASTASGTAVQSSTKEKFFQLWDGTSGATRDWWNLHVAAAWKRTLGDWTDAKRIAFGTTPYASAQVGAADGTRPVDFDVKSLVQKWLADGNRGALLRGRGGNVAIYASRENADPTLRPSLTVTTDKGKFACACVADSWLDASTVVSLGTQSSFRVATSAIQFDLSSVAGTVVSATMRLHTIKQFGSGFTDVYLLDPPLVLDEPAGKAEMGFAAKYPKDAGIDTYRISKKTGIAADPSVFMCADFSDGWEKAWDVHGALIVDRPFNAELGHQVARCQMTRTQPTSMSMRWFFEKHGQPEPEEMYVRAYVLFESDWFSTKESSKAYVAANGRYGWLSPVNKDWQPAYGGTGGGRTTGCFHPAGVAVKGFPVYDKAKDIYSGWSTRLHTMATKPADGNPYPDYVPIGAYIYDADMAGRPSAPFAGYGSLPRVGSQSAGWPVCKLDRWYCIELRVKMNTLDTSTADAYGNCDGFSNGIEEVWVDGVKYYSRTNKRFRRHPKIKIQGPWIDWFHGGTLLPVATHHHRIGNIVAASRYIGPIGGTIAVSPPPPVTGTVGTVPSWVANLAIGQQYRIPNSSYWGKDVAAQYTVAHPDLNWTQGSGPEGFIHLHGGHVPKLVDRMAYSGAGWNPDTCEFYLFGGGHASSFGNEVLRFRALAEKPVWEVVGQPSPDWAVSYCRTGTHCPPLTWSNIKGEGGYNLDGKPKSAHMCTRNFYLRRDNSLWNFGGGVTMAGGQSSIDRFDCATQQWSPPNSYGHAWTSFNPSLGKGEYRDYAVVDERDDTVYLIRHAGSGGIHRWGGPSNPLSMVGMGALSSIYMFENVPFFAWPAIIDERRNCIVIATGGHNTKAGPLNIVKVDLASGAKSLHKVKWAVPEVQFWHGHSMVHDTDGDRYLIFVGNAAVSKSFYTIDANNLTVDVLNISGDTLPAIQRFWTLNHLRYSPILKGTLLVSHGPHVNPTHDGCSVYFVRLH